MRSSFNPHRPRRAGATREAGRTREGPDCSNPHRPRRAGATPRPKPASAHRTLFQSSPAPKGRCNGRLPVHQDPAPWFQSSPAPKGRCNVHCRIVTQDIDGVSILTGPEGPVQRRRRRFAGRRCRVQSSPALKGRCNNQGGVVTDMEKMFQSSPALKGRCNGRFPSAGMFPTGAIIPESPVCGEALRRSGRADHPGKPAELGVRADIKGGCIIAIFGSIYHSLRCAKSGKRGGEPTKPRLSTVPLSCLIVRRHRLHFLCHPCPQLRPALNPAVTTPPQKLGH